MLKTGLETICLCLDLSTSLLLQQAYFSTVKCEVLKFSVIDFREPKWRSGYH